jgi:RNA polymerase-binding transcription factor DksA
MMDEKVLEELKQKLTAEKEKLEGELSKLANKEADGDYEAKFEDMGRSEEDNAEEVEEYATKVSITETLEKNLKDTIDALQKMEAATYGKCEKCSGDIRLERLQAYPAARICMKCSETN